MNHQFRTVSMLLVILFYQSIKAFEVIILSGIGCSLNADYADGMVIDIIQYMIKVQRQMILSDRNSTQLHIPVYTELFPAYLICGANDQIRTRFQRIYIYAFLSCLISPAELHGHSCQHACLTGSDRRCSQIVALLRHIP